MPSNKTPKLNAPLSHRQVNDFRTVRLDVVNYGRRNLIRLGFEARAKGSAKWQLLDVYALLDVEDLRWLLREISRAERIAATLSDEEDG